MGDWGCCLVRLRTLGCFQKSETKLCIITNAISMLAELRTKTKGEDENRHLTAAGSVPGFSPHVEVLGISPLPVLFSAACELRSEVYILSYPMLSEGSGKELRWLQIRTGLTSGLVRHFWKRDAPNTNSHTAVTMHCILLLQHTPISDVV